MKNQALQNGHFCVKISKSTDFINKKHSFNLFQENLQKVIDSMKNLRPHTIVITGDFNFRSSQWWPGDRNLPEGIVLDQLFKSNNLTQLIDQLIDDY